MDSDPRPYTCVICNRNDLPPHAHGRERVVFSESRFVGRPGDTLTLTLGPAGGHAYTLTGHDGHPISHGVLDRLDFRVVTAEPGERVLPVRAEPEPDCDGVTRTHYNSVTYPVPATSLGSRPIVTISHEHEHPHTRDDDALAFAYRHAHHHDHTGPGAGTVWLNEHAREAHDHPHTDARDHEHDEYGS